MVNKKFRVYFLTFAAVISLQCMHIDGIKIACDSPRVEAGLSDGIFGKGGDDVVGDAVGNVKKQVQGSVEDAINKALAINVDGLHSHRRDMIEHINLASSCMAGAIYKVGIASKITDESLIGYYGSAANAMKNDRSNLGNSYDFASHSVPVKEIEKNLQELMMSDDSKEAKAERDQQLSWSKTDRTFAIVYSGLAMRDATFIIKEASKGLKNIKNLDSLEGLEQTASDLQNSFNEIVAVAKDVEKLCGNISAKNKELNAATKNYDKKNNIKGASKKEVEEEVKKLEMR